VLATTVVAAAGGAALYVPGVGAAGLGMYFTVTIVTIVIAICFQRVSGDARGDAPVTVCVTIVTTTVTTIVTIQRLAAVGFFATR
jgi:uncharacterized membrane protein YiaA